MRRKLITGLLATGSLVVTAQPAFAKAWGPINTKSGSTVLGTASGSFTIQTSQYAHNSATYRDTRNNGHGIFVSGSIFFFEASEGSSTPHWVEDASFRYPNNDYGDGRSFTWTTNDPLHGNTSQTRSGDRICEDLSLQPDNCSLSAITTLSY